jgi:HemY protein
MWRVLLYLALLSVAAYGAVWLADNPETVSFTWAGREYTTSLAVAVVAIIVTAMVLSFVWAFIRWILRAPERFGRGARQRRRERGLAALSRGIIAVGAGDLASARRYAGEAERLVGTEPLALLLKAQAAQATGNRDEAETAFRQMTDRSETRVLGLRGLFVEARRNGDAASARAYAEEAARLAPAASWANEAVLEAHSAEGDWPAALRMVERRASLGLVDRGTARRQRAVLHTADALGREERDPDGALAAAEEAVRLAPDLVPAAALAGRLLSRRADLRRAAKILERAWRKNPHPELAAAYINVRPGDSAVDRLHRAETLARLSSWAPEARLAIARTAIEARQFARARDALQPLLDERPTVRVCLMMAELEQAEGAAGRVREWLARATHAPRDKAWIADGVVSETWAPVSPVSGRLDAFVWDTPPDVLGGPDEAGRLTFAEAEPEPEQASAPALPPAAAPEPPAADAKLPTPQPPEQAHAAAEPAATPAELPSADKPAEPAPEKTAEVTQLPLRNPSPALSTEPIPAEPPKGIQPGPAANAPARDPAPVVFPVPHAPDDPGAENEAEPRPRRRFLG